MRERGRTMVVVEMEDGKENEISVHVVVANFHDVVGSGGCLRLAEVVCDEHVKVTSVVTA